MKKKSMILAVASLGSMAIIGTGFAGWVISANAEVKTNGVITAYDVKDQRLKVSEGKWTTPVSKDGKSGKIVFGKPSDTTGVTNPWFTFESDVKEEVLTNTFEFTVASGDENDHAAFTVEPTIEINGDKKTAWSQAIIDGIVAKPTAAVTLPTSFQLNGTNAVTVQIDLTFNWGEHFKVDDAVKNPYHFYNAHTATDKIGDTTKSYGDDAADFMAKFNGITSVEFVLSIAVARGVTASK